MKRGIVAGVALLALALGGCDWNSHSDAPDPCNTGDNCHAGTHQRVIKMPDGFRNVAVSCLGTNGVYVTSAGAGDTLPSSTFVLKDDPNCAG